MRVLGRLVTGLLSLMLVGSAFAASFVPWQDGNWSADGIGGTWADNSSGSFFWATNGLPTAADDVILNGTKTISLDTDATINTSPSMSYHHALRQQRQPSLAVQAPPLMPLAANP